MLVPFLLAAPALADAPAEAPIKTVEESLEVPAGMSPEAALGAVGDIAAIFERYEPAIPWVPGVSIHLEKEVVAAGSASTPTILELPVDGNVAGKQIVERAHVTATSRVVACDDGSNGRVVVLDFSDSTYNIERRIDRIEITACLEKGSADRGGPDRVRAVGRMYQGYRPEDPAFNAMMESIGTKAIQTAFLRQVTPILEAVVAHWGALHPAG